MDRLAGKVAFITGGTGGIGKVCAELFAAEGAKVVVVGRRQAEGDRVAAAIRSQGGEATFIRTDVTDEAAVRHAIHQTVRAYGAMNVLLNNAGGSSPEDGTVTSGSLEEFWRVIKLDLFGTFLCCRFAIPEMIRCGGGSIINSASIAGVKGMKDRDAYTAAKGGIVALTRSMAVEFCENRIRVNAIAASGVGTERIRAMIEADPRARAAVEAQPLGLIEPIEIARLSVFLASDESPSITGEIFPVTGGR